MSPIHRNERQSSRTVERLLAAIQETTKDFTSKSARLLIYFAAAATIAQVAGWDPAAVAAVSPAIGRFVELVGANLLASMMDRVASREDLQSEDIRDLITQTLAGVNLDALTEQEFYHAIARIQKQDTHRFQIINQQLNLIVSLLEQRTSDPGASNNEAFSRFSEMPVEVIPEISTLPGGSHIPFHWNPLFTGREDDLRNLVRLLRGTVTDDPGEIRIGQAVVVLGMGGIGKTQLAVEFAYRFGQYFTGGVYWLNFGNLESLPSQIANYGLSMNIQPDYAMLSIDKQVNLVQRTWSNSIPRLLIFDNLDDDSAEQILDQWRPKGSGTRVLITSRRGEWSPTLGVNLLVLGEMHRQQSIRFLQKYMPELTDEVASQIAVELGDLPLALDLAGNYLKRYQKVEPPQTYLEKLRDPGLLNHKSLSGYQQKYSPTGHDMHVGRTFAISLNRLKKSNKVDQTALAILGRAAHFSPEAAIPWDLLVSAVRSAIPSENFHILEFYQTVFSPIPNEQMVDDGLSRLHELGLIQLDAQKSVLMHRLVCAFVLESSIKAGRGKDPQGTVEFIVKEWAVHALITHDPKEITDWAPHFKYVTDNSIKRSSSWAANLSSFYAEYIQQTGDTKGAIFYARQALLFTKSPRWIKDPYRATLANNLANYLTDYGDSITAQKILKEVLEVFEKTEGKNSPMTAKIILNLGGTYEVQGDLQEAYRCYQQARTIFENTLGPDHPETANSLSHLASILNDVGQFKEAIGLFDKALAIEGNTYGSEDIRRALTMMRKGDALLQIKDLAGSENLYQQSLSILMEKFGPEHPYIGVCLAGLAAVKKGLQEYEAAQSLYEQALAIQIKFRGSRHREVAALYTNLADVHTLKGDLAEAQTFIERAISILEAVHPKNNPEMSMTYATLGFVLREQKLYRQALEVLKKANASAKEVLGPEDPNRAMILTLYGLTLKDLGQTDTAMPHLVEAERILSQTYGPNHPVTQQARKNITDQSEIEQPTRLTKKQQRKKHK